VSRTRGHGANWPAPEGIDLHRVVPRDNPETTLTVLDALVVDPTVNGVVVVQPVRSLPAGVVAAHLPASKDVEAVTPAALSAAAEGRRRGTPVAEACLATLVHLGVDCSRARILVVGHGPTGGRPIAQRLLATGAQVSVIQSNIDEVDPLPPYDVLISAIGLAGVMPRAAIRPGTTVLDVGTSLVDGQLRGDITPEAGAEAQWVTPVPGATGRRDLGIGTDGGTPPAGRRPRPAGLRRIPAGEAEGGLG
jgi:methylenetetrahydrofolate dehydrogenase (NADP+) / methenyltetrahydrofolate cyclohydrolase